MPTAYRLTESGIGDLRIEGKALLATLGEDEEYTVAVSGRPDAADGQERRAAPTWATRPSPAGSRRSAPSSSARCAPPRTSGILLRETSNSFATELGHQLLYGAAAAYPVDAAAST